MAETRKWTGFAGIKHQGILIGRVSKTNGVTSFMSRNRSQIGVGTCNVRHLPTAARVRIVHDIGIDQGSALGDRNGESQGLTSTAHLRPLCWSGQKHHGFSVHTGQLGRQIGGCTLVGLKKGCTARFLPSCPAIFHGVDDLLIRQSGITGFSGHTVGIDPPRYWRTDGPFVGCSSHTRVGTGTGLQIGLGWITTRIAGLSGIADSSRTRLPRLLAGTARNFGLPRQHRSRGPQTQHATTKPHQTQP